MLDPLSHLFAAVCGQNPEHTWAPGGLLLPCCQRCTGFYVGALVAMLLHLWLRPRISGRFLELHGVLLLQMVPFGFHWLPQGPVSRTVTGLLFGSGVVTFLWLVPRARLPAVNARHRPHATWSYSLGLGASLGLLPVTAAWGDTVGALWLSCLAFGGATGLAGLALANVGLGLGSLWRLCRCVKPEASP